MINKYTLLSDNKSYFVSIKGCEPLRVLPLDDRNIVVNKIHKIKLGRNNWGTCSIQGKPVTIFVKEEEN